MLWDKLVWLKSKQGNYLSVQAENIRPNPEIAPKSHLGLTTKCRLGLRQPVGLAHWSPALFQATTSLAVPKHWHCPVDAVATATSCLSVWDAEGLPWMWTVWRHGGLGGKKQASIPQRQRRCMLGTWANISDRETCSWPRRNICHLSNRGLISNIWNIITLHFGELEKVAYFQLSDLDPIPVFLLNLRNEAKSHLHSNGVGAKQNHSMNSMAG